MNVLIVDDHGIVRQGLRSFMEKQADIEVIGETQSGQEAVKLAKELKPNMMIMDISMPDMNGVEATRRIIEENPDIKIIALSMHTEKHFVIEMLRAGALGYVLKSYLFDEVLRAMRTVAVNGYYLSPRITDIMVEDYIKGSAINISSDVKDLSESELQIVRYLSEGKTTKQIALILHMSPKTADAKRRRIMKKIDIDSLADLTKYAICKGLTSAEF